MNHIIRKLIACLVSLLLATAAASAFWRTARAQQAPEIVYSITMTAQQVADNVNGLLASDIPTRTGYRLIMSIQGQVEAQNKAREARKLLEKKPETQPDPQ